MRFSSRTFRKRLKRRVLKGRKTRKNRKHLGGGNTLNRSIPSEAVLANPPDVAEYHGNNASTK